MRMDGCGKENLWTVDNYIPGPQWTAWIIVKTGLVGLIPNQSWFKILNVMTPLSFHTFG